MIIPVGDLNKTRRTAWVNWLLIAANFGVFFWMLSNPNLDEKVFISYALVPNTWADNWRSLFTSMFMHAGWGHILGNMLFLYIAGDNVEDRLGHIQYLVFYLVAGLAGSAAHVVYSTHFGSGGGIPTVGASGAISGVMGAYLVFFPKAQIKFMIWLIIFIRYFTLPSWGVIGFWVASQVMMARNQWEGNADKQTAMVAVFAHLGGFAFGFLVGLAARMFGKAPKRKSE